MKKLTLFIDKNELDNFKRACKLIDNIQFLGWYPDRDHSLLQVMFSYEYPENLFFLGQAFNQDIILMQQASMIRTYQN